MSFYLQITDRCNMKCAHCCFDCRKKGTDMTRDTYHSAIDFIAEYDMGYITIGGGEPTLHPEFWAILGLSIGTFDGVWMATNGSQTKIALALATMASREIIGCALSQDIWHDPIDPKVVAAFTNAEKNGGGAELRDVSGMILNHGRAKKNDLATLNRRECCCDSFFIKPTGEVKFCGCKDSPVIGNVVDGIPEVWTDLGYDMRGEQCYKNLPKGWRSKVCPL